MNDIKTTRFLQFQLSNAHEKIEELEDTIAIMETDRTFGAELTKLRNNLNYWKGKCHVLQEVWDFRRGN